MDKELKGYLHNVLVKVETKEKETQSGLVIKEQEKNVTSGIVLSVGKEVKEISDNDIVYFQKGLALEVSKDVYSVFDENILAVQ